MRLSAICEALSKQLAQKTFQLHQKLESAYGEYLKSSEQDSEDDSSPFQSTSDSGLHQSSFNEFMNLIRNSDINYNMPHGDYILKVFQRSINDMYKYVTTNTDSVYLDTETVYTELSKNCKEAIEQFVTVKKAIASSGLSTNINDYAPVPNKQMFEPINAAIQAGYQYRASLSGDTLGMPGVELVHTEENDENPDIIYRTYLVKDPRSLAGIALGYAGGDPVGWCTKEQAKAQEYTDYYDNYVIFRNQQPTSQFSIFTGRDYLFGQVEGKIAEHQDSQNNKERREQLIAIAKQVENESLIAKGEFLEARGLSKLSQVNLKGLKEYMHDHSLGDNDEERQNTIITRMRAIKGYYDAMMEDIPLFRSIFGEVLPYSLGDFLSCIASAIELGIGKPADGGIPTIPITSTDEGLITKEFSQFYRVGADIIYQIESVLEQIPEDTGERPMLLTELGTAIDKLRKDTQGRIALNTIRALKILKEIETKAKEIVLQPF